MERTWTASALVGTESTPVGGVCRLSEPVGPLNSRSPAVEDEPQTEPEVDRPGYPVEPDPHTSAGQHVPAVSASLPRTRYQAVASIACSDDKASDVAPTGAPAGMNCGNTTTKKIPSFGLSRQVSNARRYPQPK